MPAPAFDATIAGMTIARSARAPSRNAIAKPLRLGAVLGGLAWTTYAGAQPAKIPPNTISCDGFRKQADGSWLALATNPPFDIGNAKDITVASSVITPGLMSFGDADLYEVIEAKCGKKPI